MANGTLAASQLEMLSQSGTGIATIVPPATNTNQTLTLPDSTGTLSTMGVGTAVASTSGTSIDFTGIPSWAKKITVMFSGVSTNGTSNVLLQLGAGSVTSSGYLGSATVLTASAASSLFTAGMGIVTSNAASSVVNGMATITNIGSNIWAMSSNVAFSNAAGTMNSASSVTLSGTLDRVRITTVNGTDTFDAGSINIMYEG